MKGSILKPRPTPPQITSSYDDDNGVYYENLIEKPGSQTFQFSALIASIGLTVALFVSGVAFPSFPLLEGEAKMGSLLSIFSAAIAIVLSKTVCKFSLPKESGEKQEQSMNIDIDSESDDEAVDEILVSAQLSTLNSVEKSKKKVENLTGIREVEYAKQEGFLSGKIWVEETFKLIDRKSSFKWNIEEGERFKKNQDLMTMKASPKALLSGERTALNFLQFMSGITTKSRKYEKLLKGSKIRLLDTRKTLPNLRYEEKYATALGGVQNHRFSLSDALMIKDNHIKAIGKINNLRELTTIKKGNFFEIEIEKLDQILPALELNPDVLLLDNFSKNNIKKAIKIINKKALIEVSGIQPDDLSSLKDLEIDYISLGDLTKNIEAVDFSFNIK